MGAMLGLVMAGDVITLFVFWELTSITSFLLVAYNFSDPEAKKGAFKALFITGGGGIALLFGLFLYAFFNITYTMFMGRYLFVVVVPIAVLFAAGVRALLPQRHRTIFMLFITQISLRHPTW